MYRLSRQLPRHDPVTRIDEEVRRELLKIVEDDHARATEFIARLITLRTGITALGGSLWTAVIGVGVASKQLAAFLVAAAAMVLLAGVDLTYAAHYRTMRSHVRRLERVLSANYKLCVSERRQVPVR